MNRKELSCSRFDQIGVGEIRLFLESWSPPCQRACPPACTSTLMVHLAVPLRWT